MTEFPNEYQEDRTPAKGETDQEKASLALMAIRLLGMTFTAREEEALAVLIGAVVRETPKVERSSLVNLIRLVTNSIVAKATADG